MITSSRKITFAEFGDMLQSEWEQGNIGSDVHRSIEMGLLPIRELRAKLRWIIERDGDGLRLMVEDDSTN
jgi:hypothetical protein